MVKLETIINYLDQQITALKNGTAPKNHAASDGTYGLAKSNLYGHVKLSDSFTTSGGNADSGVAASSKAVVDSYTQLNAALTNGGATKIGKADVGATNHPIFIQSGTPKPCAYTVGGPNVPIYSKAGTLTACNEFAPRIHTWIDGSGNGGYGIGGTNAYGHVKLSNDYTTTNLNQRADNAVGASAWAVQSVYSFANANRTTINGLITDVNNINKNMAPKSHAVNANTYGLGTSGLYGHVKLSDVYKESKGGASASLAASQNAVYNAYNTLLNKIDPIGSYYVDYVTSDEDDEVPADNSELTFGYIEVPAGIYVIAAQCAIKEINGKRTGGRRLDIQGCAQNTVGSDDAVWRAYARQKVDCPSTGNTFLNCVAVLKCSTPWVFTADIRQNSGTEGLKIYTSSDAGGNYASYIRAIRIA